MKIYATAEFWYTGILGVIVVLGIYPVISTFQNASAAPNHEPVWEQLLGVLLSGFLLLKFGCFCWEWLLLRKRQRQPDASFTVPILVFVVGLFAELLTMGWWSR